jgi:AcrR family transcriptional regulator
MLDVVSRLHAAHQRGPRLTADERRDEIVDAAIIEFAAGGLAATSTEAIARRAGVSQPYVFRLFGTKHELFIAAIGRMYERISAAFEEAARHPGPDAPEGYNPTLMAMGKAYGDLVADRNLLRLQLHGFAACDDPAIRAFVRQGFAALTQQVARLSGVPAIELRTFFAEGMLMNVAAAMGMTEGDLAWPKICEGGLA